MSGRPVVVVRATVRRGLPAASSITTSYSSVFTICPLSAFHPGHACARRARARRRRAGCSTKIQDKLLATLKAAKGLQLKDVVARSGLDSGAVQYHLRGLWAKRKVRVVGSRKEARWFA